MASIAYTFFSVHCNQFVKLIYCHFIISCWHCSVLEDNGFQRHFEIIAAEGLVSAFPPGASCRSLYSLALKPVFTK